MGCTSSEVQSLPSSYLHRRPQLWIILGGPGSNKGKIIEYLVRDYKFMYLSLFEILQFEKQRPTNQSQLIKKAILEKKDFSTQLITQLFKKAIASLGPRRYLIDGFPRNKQDMEYFEKQPFTKQITLHKVIHVQVSIEKMKLTGIQAKKNDKRPQQEVQKEVNTVIEEFKKQQEQITKFYKEKNSIISVPQRETQDQTYNELRLQLQNLPMFRQIHQGDARVFFASFSHESDKHRCTYEEFTKRYGLNHLDYTNLIQECRQKNSQDSKYLQECEKKKESPSSEFVIYLFKKQLQKKDYVGNYIVTGFPRNINDALMWEKTFGWEVGVESFIEFQSIEGKTVETANKEDKNNGNNPLKQESKVVDKPSSNKKVLEDFYQKQQKFVKITYSSSLDAFGLIEKFMIQKAIPKRKSQIPHKLIFISTINEEFIPKLEKHGARYIQNDSANTTIQKLSPPQKFDVSHIKEINMLYCYENETKENGLYSQLIKSYLVSGMPLPGYLAVKILLKNLQFIISSQGPKHSRSLMIMIKGFPNSAQQISTWNQQIGERYPVQSIIYFGTSQGQIKQILTKHKVEYTQATVDKIKRNSLKLEDYLKPHQKYGHKMNDEKQAQDFVNYLI